MQLAIAIQNPGDKGVLQVNWGQQKTLIRYKCSVGKAELSKELQLRIKRLFNEIEPKLSAIIPKGSHKIELMYYGMIYTILQYNGFYLRGKNNDPIFISCSKYCELFNLNRKTLKSGIYSYDFYLLKKFNEERSKKENWIKTFPYDIKELKSIFDYIENKIS